MAAQTPKQIDCNRYTCKSASKAKPSIKNPGYNEPQKKSAAGSSIIDPATTKSKKKAHQKQKVDTLTLRATALRPSRKRPSTNGEKNDSHIAVAKEHGTPNDSRASRPRRAAA